MLCDNFDKDADDMDFAVDKGFDKGYNIDFIDYNFD
jgi:hypothetical protein